MRFQNKTVLITGAAKGIGRAIAEQYANEGARLILVDINEYLLAQTHQYINLMGNEVESFVCDVSDVDDVTICFESLMVLNWPIDILINNVGISENHNFLNLTSETFDLVYRTNVRSTMLFSQYVAKDMIKLEQGAIVNIAAARALMSEPDTEAYAASKGAVLSLTHSMAASLGMYHITVNSISPGWIYLGQTDELSEADHEQRFSQRVGKPQDVAFACLYLTDPLNDFMTGQNIILDGGMAKKTK